jgi:hypothetical protein
MINRLLSIVDEGRSRTLLYVRLVAGQQRLSGKSQPIRNHDKIQKTPAGSQRYETGAGVSDYTESHPLGLVMCI